MNVEIAQRLAEMRRAKGYSQEELAEKLGLSRQAVSKWERAESSPDTGNIIALAKLYGVTIDELLRIDDDVADDVAFESRDRASSADAQAQAAADQARAAAAQAQAAAAAVQAQPAAAAEQAQPADCPPPTPQRRERGQWVAFPYPVLCAIVFLLAGFFLEAWHPAWVVFLTIPLYYWIANVIENDPVYRERTGR